MGVPLLQVDAFTDQPFSGNPAGVCLLSGPAEAGWMQDVAEEMNLSETAFLHPLDDGYSLRWFTPTVEVELCGHATLAGAHALWELGLAEPGRQLRFHTRSGLLTAQRADAWIWLDFPARPVRPGEPPDGLLTALGAAARYVGRTERDHLLELESEAALRELHPDLAHLAALPMEAVIATAPSASADYDFVSRFFAPALGIDEDPVTGSAHCTLAPYWGGRLRKRDLLGYQASARGGVVRVRLDGDRVQLGGQAVTVVRGELEADGPLVR